MCVICETTFDQLYDYNEEEIVDFLVRHGVFKSRTTCPTCGQEVLLDRSRLIFRCQKMVNRRKQKGSRCNWIGSARTGSFFGKSRLPMKRLWRLVLHILFLDAPQKFLEENYQLSSHTIVDWKSFCREVYLDHNERHSERIGGPGEIVEIDEAKFGKRKYNRGRIIEGQWILGGIERGSSRSFLVAVPNRTARTLVRLIRRWVLPGTTVVTDCWRAYRRLSQYEFHHLTVNHSQNFVDPLTGAHTNTVERRWRDARGAIPKYGNRKEHYGGYLARFLFTKRYSYRYYAHVFFEAAATLYPPTY